MDQPSASTWPIFAAFGLVVVAIGLAVAAIETPQPSPQHDQPQATPWTAAEREAATESARRFLEAGRANRELLGASQPRATSGDVYAQRQAELRRHLAAGGGAFLASRARWDRSNQVDVVVTAAWHDQPKSLKVRGAQVVDAVVSKLAAGEVYEWTIRDPVGQRLAKRSAWGKIAVD